MKIKVNGSEHSVTASPDTPLLWVLREQLALTGTKFSCGMGECGACMVLLDGDPTLSCQTSLAEAAGSEIVTIEGLSGEVADRVRAAWVAEQVPQCGYCQPGQVITATALLERVPAATDADIDDSMSVLCRCGTYPDIRRAIRRATKEQQ